MTYIKAKIVFDITYSWLELLILTVKEIKYFESKTKKLHFAGFEPV